jgi:hypothetical protein
VAMLRGVESLPGGTYGRWLGHWGNLYLQKRFMLLFVEWVNSLESGLL